MTPSTARRSCARSCAQNGRNVAARVDDPPEVLEPAAGLPERVALDVEEEVAALGGGSSANPRAGSGASTFHAWPFVRAATCSAACSRSVSNVRGAIAGGRASSGARGELGDRRDPRRLEPPTCRAASARRGRGGRPRASALSQRCWKSQRPQNETGSG